MSPGPLQVTKRGIAYSVVAGIEPTIVFLHGLAGYGNEWKPLVEYLNVDNRIVLVDLRGHGASSRTVTEDIVDEVIADVVDVIETLVIKQCVLVGQSAGGLVALDAVERMPRLVSRLVLVEAGVRPITPKALSSVQTWLADFPGSFKLLNEAESFFGGSALRQKTWAQGLSHDNDGYHPRFDRSYASRLIPIFGRQRSPRGMESSQRGRTPGCGDGWRHVR